MPLVNKSFSNTFTFSRASPSTVEKGGRDIAYPSGAPAFGDYGILVQDGSLAGFPDSLSVPLSNHMPAPGKLFTVFVSVFNLANSGDLYLFSVDGKIALRRNGTAIEFLVTGADAVERIAKTGNDYKMPYLPAVVACRYDGSENALFINSDKFTTPSKPNTFDYSSVLSIFIGSKDGVTGHVNTQISGFRVYHGALSDSKVAEVQRSMRIPNVEELGLHGEYGDIMPEFLNSPGNSIFDTAMNQEWPE